MKQVCTDIKGNIYVEEVPSPQLVENGVLVQVGYSLISSGTEGKAVGGGGNLFIKALREPELVRKALKIAKFRGIKKTAEIIRDKSSELRIAGYSTSGIVIEVGKEVHGVKKGDRVACAGGGYATHSEINYIPKNLFVKLPSDVPLDEAAFTALGAIGLQSIRRARIEVGETVIVIGLGLIGQLVCQMLKVAGCKTIGLDIDDDRIHLALENGLDYGIPSQESTYIDEIISITGGLGADATLICAHTSASDVVNQSFAITRERGKIILVGDVGLHIEREMFYRKEQDFLISRSYGPGRYDQRYEEKGIDYPFGFVRWTENRNMEAFVNMIAQNKINVSSLISEKYCIDDAQQAYENLSSHIGVLFEYKASEALKVHDTIIAKTEIALRGTAEGKTRLGIIGGGAFAKSFHLPNLQKIPEFDLYAIATRTGTNAKSIAKKYQMTYCTTNYHELMNDPRVDAVLIATRHDLHKKLVSEAIEAGKHVFVEKPLALSIEDCEEIQTAVQKSEMLLTVGFNRRFSPFSKKAKRIIQGVSGPKAIVYRINAGALPTDHWLLDPMEGGGRILGEACHFLDLLHWFLSEEPTEISAYSVDSTSSGIVNENNISCILKFDSGSTAMLLYNCLGNANLSKERIEIFGGNKAVVIDDFSELSFYGCGEKGVKKKRQEKGFFEQWISFRNAIRGTQPLEVTVEDGLRATKMSVHVLNSLRTSKPVKM